MVIEICDKVFNSMTAHCSLEDLEKLIGDAVYQDRCKLVMNPRVLKSDYYLQMDDSKRELIKLLVMKTGNSCPIPDGYITPEGDTITDEKFYSVREGIVFIDSPLEILVENSLNDARFFRALFKAFVPKLPFREYEERKWVVFSNAGGCSNTPNYIKAELESNGHKSKMLKCFVLLDSDRQFPGDNHKQHAVTSYLDENNVPYHILEKRMMENYLPDEAYDEIRSSQNTDWIECYLHLTPNQKDFINISEGIDGDIPDRKQRGNGIHGRALLPSAIKVLYDDISCIQYEVLSKGLVLKDFKSSFPKAFESYHVHKSSLKKRTAHQNDPEELEHIVNNIIQLV